MNAPDPNKTDGDQAGAGTPPAPPAPAKKDAKKLYLFGSIGCYAKAPAAKGGTMTKYKFGDELLLTDTEYKALTKCLRGQLVPAEDWADHRKKMLKSGAAISGKE